MSLKDVVERIKESVDIVDYIGSKIQLKRSGRNFKALCPFHNEKTPSFYVSPSLKMFHCFGCGISGDIVKFVQEYEKLSFIDAIKVLAEYANIEIDFKGETLDLYYKVNEEIARYYHYLLLNDKNALSYLKKRNIKDETIEKFLLGYAPNVNNNLLRFEKTFGREILLKLGLVGAKDRFKNRIIFPIFTISGKIAGFGGRILGEGEPKYINSPESPIYSKGNILYSLYHSRKSILEKGEVVLMEGYFDYLSCFQEGFENILATLGTSLTENQSLILSRYANKIVLFFDMDSSGKKASFRNLGLLIDKDVEVFVAKTDYSKDPDELIRNYGIQKMKSIVSEAYDFIDIMIDRCKEKYDLKNTTQLTTAIKEFGDILYMIKDPLKREIYGEKIASALDVKKEWLFFKKKKEKDTTNKNEMLNYLEKIEILLLLSIIENKYDIEKIQNIDETEFSFIQLREGIRLIKNGKEVEKDIITKVPIKYKNFIFTNSLGEEDNFENLYKKWKIKKIEEKIQKNALYIKKLEIEGKDPSDILRIQNELLKLKLHLQKEV